MRGRSHLPIQKQEKDSTTRAQTIRPVASLFSVLQAPVQPARQQVDTKHLMWSAAKEARI